MKKRKSFLPKKIKIGGFDYEIIFVERFVDNNDMNVGLCLSPRTCIYISEYSKEYKLVKPKIIQTLLHEIFHAIDNIYCNSIFREEDVVLLESLWFHVLADNDLHISSEKMPSSIRVLGHTYEIIHNYDFELDNSNSVGSCTNFFENKIYMSNNMDEGHIKVQILSCITEIFINNGFFNDNFPHLPFSQGLYQVLKDNKLDVFIRKHCGGYNV